MAKMTTCEWCSDYVLEGNAGDYYHAKECEARYLRKRLRENAVERKRLEKRLEMAEYVGD